jgi:hypothetical protein
MQGVLVGAPKSSETNTGTLKTIFTLSTDGRDLPLYFHVVSFGLPAAAAAKLVDGDAILLSGRMVASTATKTLSIVANSIENLFDSEETNDDASPASATKTATSN